MTYHDVDTLIGCGEECLEAGHLEEIQRLNEIHLAYVEENGLLAKQVGRTWELEQRIEQLEAGLRDLLDVAERIRGGDTKLDPERWYAVRDFARSLLKSKTLTEEAST